MADLNTLLRWAVENTVPSDGAAPAAAAPAGADGMKLTFKPAVPGQQASAGAATLHPSDAQFPVADLSPASTPGPATPTADAPPVRTDLTTEMLDLIMGKSDSMTMKEKMAAACDETLDVDVRVEALDDFEMLIELIDNANNMAILKLWKPLLELLQSPHPEIVQHALWIIGTAIQNNLKAQAMLFVNNALPTVMNFVVPADASTEPFTKATRAKGVYAMSAALKHWPLASSALSADNGRGYAVLRESVADDETIIRRKVAFLLGTLVNQARDKFDDGEMPSEVRTLLEDRAKEHGGVEEDLIAGLKREGVFTAALAALESSDDVDFEENAMRALSRAAEFGGLTEDEKKKLQAVWAKWAAEGQKERGLDGQDGEAVAASLA